MSSASRGELRGRGSEAIRDSALDARRAGLEVNRSCLKSASVLADYECVESGCSGVFVSHVAQKASRHRTSLALSLAWTLSGGLCMDTDQSNLRVHPRG